MRDLDVGLDVEVGVEAAVDENVDIGDVGDVGDVGEDVNVDAEPSPAQAPMGQL